MQKHWAYIAFAACGVIASIAYAAATGDRLKSPVLIGQHTATSLSLSFDEALSPNASIAVDSTGDLVFTAGGSGNIFNESQVLTEVGSGGAPSYSFIGHTNDGMYLRSPGVTVIESGGSDMVEITSNSLFADRNGTPTQYTEVSGGNNSNDPYVNFSGGSPQMRVAGTARLTLPAAGGLAVAGTGGNTPHACVVRTANSTATSSCSGGEIAVGGGGTCVSGDILNFSAPNGGSSSTPPTSWIVRCELTNGTIDTPISTSAVCCPY